MIVYKINLSISAKAFAGYFNFSIFGCKVKFKRAKKIEKHVKKLIKPA